MLRRRRDENDIVAGLERAVAMHDEARLKREARARLGLDACKFGLGHAGIMFERHRRDRAVLIAHRAGEGDDSADVAPPGLEPRDLGADVEIFPLHADHLQPPVTGGKKAISRAPAIRASWRTCWRSIAARITSARAKACSNSGPRPFSQSISSATVVTPSGGLTSSAAMPAFSLTQAK